MVPDSAGPISKRQVVVNGAYDVIGEEAVYLTKMNHIVPWYPLFHAHVWNVHNTWLLFGKRSDSYMCMRKKLNSEWMVEVEKMNVVAWNLEMDVALGPLSITESNVNVITPVLVDGRWVILFWKFGQYTVMTIWHILGIRREPGGNTGGMMCLFTFLRYG